MQPDYRHSSTARRDIFGFIHLATHGDWVNILAEQLFIIRRSGLYERTKRFFIGLVGPGAMGFTATDPKIEVIHRGVAFEEFEFPTLRYLHQFSQSHTGLAYYIHAKGAFRDSPFVRDWRRYMQYFVLERHRDCIDALNSHDICGVNWREWPWPHFSGNFWWATLDYVKRLASLEAMPPLLGGDQGHRHQCERWIGSGAGVRPAILHHSSNLDHYLSAYPRRRYAADAERQLPISCNPPLLLKPEDVNPGDLRQLRVALVFDDVARPDTTGIYCLRALQSMARVVHLSPAKLAAVKPGDFDLYFYIDDGLDYPLRSDLRPSAMWAIDTHIVPERLLGRAGAADYVFAAQRDGAEMLRRHKINCVAWLPLACDPGVHACNATQKEWDTCFVGHLSTPARLQLADLIGKKFARSFIGQRFFSAMAGVYSSSRTVLNLSIRNDVNMRVFEAAACGSLLITNDLAENGMAELFDTQSHLVVYRGFSELLARIEYYLCHDDQREQIAAAGRLWALATHTYTHRMAAALSLIAREKFQGSQQRLLRESTTNRPLPGRHASAMISIIILTRDQISYTRKCVESIRRYADVEYEIIIIDNGSSDGTLEYLRAQTDIKLTVNPENAGFAAGVNQGIAVSRGDYLLLLNNDTILTPCCIQRMLKALRSDPAVGIVGPCSNNVPGAQKVRGDYEIDELNEVAESIAAASCGQIQKVNALVGFCMLMRRNVIESIGLFDESYGIGTYEDYDYCIRALRAGYQLAIARDAFVHHFGSVTLHAATVDVDQLLRTNQGVFASKWRGQIDAIIQDTQRSNRGMTSIIIVTHNQAAYTKRCIESIVRHTATPYEIVVVDNASTDETLIYLRSIPTLRLILNKTNTGFPTAANQGILASRGEQILLLNNDVVVTCGWLQRLLSAMDRDRRVGLVGPVTNYASGPQQIAVDYSSLDEVDAFALRRAQHYAGKSSECPRLVGFCLLLPRALVDRIGMLDERFGLGNFEDDDYCRRARDAGFRAVIAEDCFVHHFGSVTFRQSGLGFKEILDRNRRLYEEKWDRPGENQMVLAEAPGTIQERKIVLSVCLIVRDNARTLRGCLESIKPWVDEIVVIDTGSTDNTLEIAEQLGARIGHFTWCDDFAAARNASIRLASGKWIFWMDSDDTIDQPNGRKLRELADRDHPATTTGFIMQVHCPSAGDPGAYATPTVVDHVKMFRNGLGIEFAGRIHEQVLPAIRRLGGEVTWTDIYIVHSGSDISPEGKARKHRRDQRILELELSEQPDSTFTLFNMGMTLLDAGRAEQALGYLCRSLQLASTGESHLPKLYALLVQAYTELGRRATALWTCVQALRVCPGDPELMFRRAILEQATGDLPAAERSYRALIENPPGRHFSSMDQGILGIKCRHNLAILHQQCNRHVAAAAAWREVLTFDRRNPVAWRGLMEALAAAADIDALHALCRELRTADISDSLSTICEGRLLVLQGQIDAAVEHLKNAITGADSTGILHELCALTFAHRLHDEAELWLEELTRRFPDDPAAHHNLAAVYLAKQRPQRAAATARRSLELRPDHPDTQQLLDIALAQGSPTQRG